jgi:hypothetical protein
MNVDDNISFFNQTNINGPAYLLINVVFEELTTKILCPNVFKNLQYFTIIGSPSSIQSNLFESFKKIGRSKVEMVLSYGSQFSEFIFIFSGSEF